MARRTFSPQEIATQRNMQRQRQLLGNWPPLESVEADENSVRVIDVEEDIDAQARQFMVRRPPGWWMMRNGFWIPIERMSDNHFENAWRMINSRQRDTEIIQEFQMERVRRERNRLYAAQSQEADRMERARSRTTRFGVMAPRYGGISRGTRLGIGPSSPERDLLSIVNELTQSSNEEEEQVRIMSQYARDQMNAEWFASTPRTSETPTPPLPNRTRRIKE